jgi:hypothetical protein
MSNTRKATNEILRLVEDGVLDRDAVMRACLGYMSEAAVADMAHSEGFLDEDDEPEDDDEDAGE